MKKMTIELDELGAVRVSVNGQPVGLIQELKLIAAADGRPSVSITFTSLSKLSGALQQGESEVRETLSSSLEWYHELVSGFSFVDVFDRADTLPSGMPAVRPEE